MATLRPCNEGTSKALGKQNTENQAGKQNKQKQLNDHSVSISRKSLNSSPSDVRLTRNLESVVSKYILETKTRLLLVLGSSPESGEEKKIHRLGGGAKSTC